MDEPIKTAAIRVPMQRTDRLVIRRLDIQLTTAQAQALRDAMDGLYASRAVLANGLEVDRHQRAAMWLLERLAECPDENSPAPSKQTGRLQNRQ